MMMKKKKKKTKKKEKMTTLPNAGNPDVMDGVTPGMVVGPGTECIGAEHSIVTAGGLDTHIHYICPQQVGRVEGSEFRV